MTWLVIIYGATLFCVLWVFFYFFQNRREEKRIIKYKNIRRQNEQ